MGETPAAVLDLAPLREVITANGFTFADVKRVFAECNDVTAEAYIAAARARWAQEGQIEIDDATIVSGSSDNGAYVLAWVWVGDDDEEEESAESLLVSAIREELSQDGAPVGVIKVTFHTSEWDNGYFLEQSDARVMFADGQTESLAFENVGDELREVGDEQGSLGSYATLEVDLRTGSVWLEGQ